MQGLPICFKIIENNRCNLTCKSPETKSTFQYYFQETKVKIINSDGQDIVSKK